MGPAPVRWASRTRIVPASAQPDGAVAAGSGLAVARRAHIRRPGVGAVLPTVVVLGLEAQLLALIRGQALGAAGVDRHRGTPSCAATAARRPTRRRSAESIGTQERTGSAASRRNSGEYGGDLRTWTHPSCPGPGGASAEVSTKPGQLHASRTARGEHMARITGRQSRCDGADSDHPNSSRRAVELRHDGHRRLRLEGAGQAGVEREL